MKCLCRGFFAALSCILLSAAMLAAGEIPVTIQTAAKVRFDAVRGKAYEVQGSPELGLSDVHGRQLGFACCSQFNSLVLSPNSACIEGLEHHFDALESCFTAKKHCCAASEHCFDAPKQCS